MDDRVNARMARLPILVVLLLAFLLRVYHLDYYSLWNDEAGQALAALQSTVAGVFAMERTHAMAMPLDYLLSHAIARISQNEFAWRFPAAFFGTLTVAVCYALARKLTDSITALLAATFCCLAPVYVYYSQEMRFYAALTCFFALGLLLLVRALQRGSPLAWMAYVLVAALGSYFHPYVLLTAVVAIPYLLLEESPRRSKLLNVRNLLISGLVLIGLLLPGYLYFGRGQSFAYDPLQWDPSVVHIIMKGFGLVAPIPTGPEIGPWEVFNLALLMLGLCVVAFHWRRYRGLLSLVIGAPLIIALIFVADRIKGYWFLSRQVLPLVTVLMICAAVGAKALLSWFTGRALPVRNQPSQRRWSRAANLLALVILLACVAAGPRLRDYYHYDKSNASSIVAALLQRHAGRESIFVLPGYEEKIYRLYLGLSGDPRGIAQVLKPSSWEQLAASTQTTSGRAFLVVPAVLTHSQRNLVQELGFLPLLSSANPGHGTRVLMVRDTSGP